MAKWLRGKKAIIESLTVGREAPVNSRLTFGRRDTSKKCVACSGVVRNLSHRKIIPTRSSTGYG